jgi:energy-coupling factor transport system permease protein
MARAEGLRYVSIGHYMPTGSPVHRLDPRTKLLAAGLLTVAMVLANATAIHLGLLATVLLVAALARIPWRALFAPLRALLPVFLVLALFQFLFARETGAAESEGAAGLSVMLLRALYVLTLFLRLVNVMFVITLLTSVATTGSLSTGIELILSPLNAVGLPGYELALVGGIALRFMPIFGETLESIMLAQRARGVSLEARSSWRIIENARTFGNLIVPLFVDLFRRVDDLTLAMQARCYQGGRKRTRLVQPTYRLLDYVVISLTALLLAGIILAQRSS